MRGAGSLVDRVNAYVRVLRVHLRTYWASHVSLVCGVVYTSVYFTFGVNVTPSLPYVLCVVAKGEFSPHRGDLVAFRWHGGGPYLEGLMFSKLVRGVPGDEVVMAGREFFVNGQSVGVAKAVSLKGEPLAAGPTGVIPEGRYYVAASHPDSLDSRYAITGWIRREALIGRAYVVF